MVATELDQQAQHAFANERSSSCGTGVSNHIPFEAGRLLEARREAEQGRTCGPSTTKFRRTSFAAASMGAVPAAGETTSSTYPCHRRRHPPECRPLAASDHTDPHIAAISAEGAWKLPLVVGVRRQEEQFERGGLPAPFSVSRRSRC